MKTVELPADRLQELIGGFPKARIAVLGDFFLDKYLEVDPALEEPSVETGKPAHQVTDVRCSPGAAGTVVCNLHALGARNIAAIGFRGDDGEGYDLAKQLNRLGCRTNHLHLTDERYTPTYLKPRDANVSGLSGEHSRYDTKNRVPTPDSLQKQVMASIVELLDEVDAIIVLDQVEQSECGVVTTAVRAAVSEHAARRPEKIFWADSRRNIRQFQYLTIKPNEFETLSIDNPLPNTIVSFEDLISAARSLREINEAPVVITRGAQGMLVSDPEWTLVPGVAIDGPIDPTGAGDSATAGTVLSLCCGATLPEAALVGNLVASITIQQLSTTGVARPDELPPRLELWRQHQGQSG